MAPNVLVHIDMRNVIYSGLVSSCLCYNLASVLLVCFSEVCIEVGNHFVGPSLCPPLLWYFEESGDLNDGYTCVIGAW